MIENPVTAGTNSSHPAQFDGRALAVIAGPCVIEDEAMILETAQELHRITKDLQLPMVFKSSYAKDNRSAVDSFRGPGMDEGLRVLVKVRERVGVPVLSDVHLPHEARLAGEQLDILQIPAFLCRQTSLLEAAGATRKPVNIKKGQFMAPGDMHRAVNKVRSTGNEQVLITERGAMFGYNNLVVDMRSFGLMSDTGCPLVYDVTHSLQLPGSGKETGGMRDFALPLARAAVGAGCHAVFLEAHPEPGKARSDASTQLPLSFVPELLQSLKNVWDAVHRS